MINEQRFALLSKSLLVAPTGCSKFSLRLLTTSASRYYGHLGRSSLVDITHSPARSSSFVFFMRMWSSTFFV